MNKKKINIVDEILDIETQEHNSSKKNSEKEKSEDTTKWYNILNQQLDSEE